MANLNNPAKRIESTLIAESKYECLNTVRWLWYCRVKPVLHPLLAMFFIFFAVAVIVAQLSIFIPGLSAVNPFSWIVTFEGVMMLDLSLMIVLTYIVFCVYYALFKLKFASYYGLYWNRQTDASSLLFFAMFLSNHLEWHHESPRLCATTSCR